jgi:MoxR-like ATPase
MEVSAGATPKQEAPVLVGASPVIMELATIPSIDWSKKYINRKINGLLDYSIYDNAMTNNENILIMGHAGSGKTMSVLGYASTRGYRYYNVSSHIGLEPTQLFGSWIPTPDGHFRWQDGPVTDLVRKGGVLLLNEVNFMPERVTTILFGLLDDRREIQIMENGGEVIKAHKDLLVIADMNPNYRGTRPMNQAWVDRFHHKLDFPYDNSIESKLIKNKALLEMATKLRELSNKGDLDTPISTRGLANFIKNAGNLNLDYAVSSYVNGFLDEEREAVRLVLDTYKPNIGIELGVIVPVAPTQIDEVTVNG